MKDFIRSAFQSPEGVDTLADMTFTVIYIIVTRFQSPEGVDTLADIGP